MESLVLSDSEKQIPRPDPIDGWPDRAVAAAGAGSRDRMSA
jgi:hypothetical protein